MENSQLNLKLGDIIEITSPTNLELHEQTHYIEYIDDKKIVIKNVSNLDLVSTVLNINEDGSLSDESITGISLLNRSEYEGFARQNGLLTHKWIDIHIGGDVPTVITGEITNLEEDMIEVTTYPERMVIYFDFAYKGLPEDIPIKRFDIRQKPVMPKKTIIDTDSVIENEDDSTVPDPNIRDVLHELYVDANTNEIIFGEELDEVIHVVELPESERRYGLELQVNDMMDELLSTIPNNQRKDKVMDNIHNLVERFKQLRNDFSKFDDNLNITGFSHIELDHKPMIEKIKKLNDNLRWIIPVVSQKRVIYTNIKNSDIIDLNISDELESQADLYKKYTDGAIRYEKLYEQQTVPFEASSDENDTHLITKHEVLADLDTIVDNLGGFKSSVADNKICKYVIQRYNLGLTKMDTQLLKSGKTIFIRSAMTPNDKITVKSVLLLPKSVSKFSKISRPGTNIATRVGLHHNYIPMFRLLNEKTMVNTHIVDDFSHELNNDLSNIKEFQLDETLENEPDKMSRFLNTILPSTESLIKITGNHKMSFLDVVKELEPFGVYTDDISLKQYNEIKIYINDQIKEFNKKYNEKSMKFKDITNLKFNTKEIINKIKFIISNTPNYEDTPEFMKLFTDGYKRDYDTYTSGELLNDVIVKDGGKLLSDIIVALSLKTLTNPTDLLSMFEPANIDDITDIEKIKPKDCVRRYLTKRYSSMKELQMDNGKTDIFYDKEFDDTPYHIVGLYSKEKKSMEPKAFVEFMTEMLMLKHDAPAEIAPELARTLIAGKKMVSEGEYAVIQPDGYFHRVKDQWVRDRTMNSDLLIDTNTLFCNLRADCFKNESNMVCESTKVKMSDLTKARLVGEFERRVETSIEQINQKIRKVLSNDYKRISRDLMLNTVKTNRFNNYAYALGKTAIVDEIIISPHARLLDLILSQHSFTKKQSDIVKFAELFCREPMEDLKEHQFWLYCKDTNTKLLPTSLNELARTFVLDLDYSKKLSEICAKQGVKSDDGDSIIDKYSGRILRKIDFVEEELYNEQGFHIVTHAVMEKDIGQQLDAILAPKQKPVFENNRNQMIYNILDSICDNIGIDIKIIQDFVMRTTIEFLEEETNKSARDKYEKKSELIFKQQGVYPISFEVHSDRLMFWYLASILLISIQTAVPSFRVKKTFPGCYKSFGGYPLTGIEDTSGIKYIACVLDKKRSSVAPWNSIEKVKLEIYISKIKDTLKSIADKPNINAMYNLKRELHITESIPEEHNVSKWLTFLPPVVPYEMGVIQTVPREFENDLLELMRKGHQDQREQLDIIKSKCVKYGYGIIELINKIVKSKDQILKTATKDPYLENACCNDSSIHEPLKYFIGIDSQIDLYNSTSKSLGEFATESKKYAKTSTLYHSEFTGINYPIVSSVVSEEDIYGVYISYCNFANDLPIPDEYISACPEKPVGFPVSASLSEQIEYLKKNGTRYSLVDFNNLMTLVRTKNKLDIPKPVVFNQVNVIFDILDKLDTNNSTVIELKMREHLRAVMTSYDPNVMVVEERESLIEFKLYLKKSNTNMLNVISTFIQDYGNITDKKNTDLQTFLNESGTPEFIRNSIYFMTKAFPSMILNDTSFKVLPKSWDFAKPHYSDLKKMIDKTWDSIREYSNDRIIADALKEIQIRCADIFLLISELPIYKPITKGEHTYYSLFDEDAITMMYTYLWYSTIYEYIVCANNTELLSIETEINKSEKRRQRLVETDLSFGLDEESYEDEDEIQEIEIQAGNEIELKEHIAKLLLAFFDIEKTNKELTISYDQISKKIRKSKNTEKQEMIDYLGKMNKDERAIEDQLKKYKIGKWNIGLQKGLIKYDKIMFEQEHAKLHEIEDQQVIVDGQEVVDIEQFGEDWNDGDFYGDHREDETEFGDI